MQSYMLPSISFFTVSFSCKWTCIKAWLPTYKNGIPRHFPTKMTWQLVMEKINCDFTFSSEDIIPPGVLQCPFQGDGEVFGRFSQQRPARCNRWRDGRPTEGTLKVDKGRYCPESIAGTHHMGPQQVQGNISPWKGVWGKVRDWDFLAIWRVAWGGS